MNTEIRFIGETPAIKKLRKEIPKLATLQALVITGGRGSGKSTVARIIHQTSKAKGTVSVLNPLTSTIADISQTCETAGKHNATILVQEIEEFSFLAQGKISQYIDRLPKRNQTRIILTCKQEIGRAQKDGKLFDRLYNSLKHVDSVAVPSLNERRDDIPPLVEYFIQEACSSSGEKLKTIDINALDFLVRREWKENVLELKSIIENSVFSSKETSIELPGKLVDELTQLEGMMANIKEKKAFSFDKSLSNLEKTLIERTLAIVSNNQTKAARILNISDANLRYRLKKFKIKRNRS